MYARQLGTCLVSGQISERVLLVNENRSASIRHFTTNHMWKVNSLHDIIMESLLAKEMCPGPQYRLSRLLSKTTSIPLILTPVDDTERFRVVLSWCRGGIVPLADDFFPGVSGASNVLHCLR